MDMKLRFDVPTFSLVNLKCVCVRRTVRVCEYVCTHNHDIV